MKHCVGPMRIENCPDPFPIPNIGDDWYKDHIRKRRLQFVKNVEDRVLSVAQQNNPSRGETCDLTTELAPDGSTRARDEGSLAGGQLGYCREVRFDRLPAQEILDFYLAQGRSIRLTRQYFR